MSVKITIAAVAAFVAVAAVPELASARTAYHPYPRAEHQRLLQLPADAYGYDAYGYAGSAQQARPSQLTGGQGHDFQLEGRF